MKKVKKIASVSFFYLLLQPIMEMLNYYIDKLMFRKIVNVVFLESFHVFTINGIRIDSE